MRLGLLPPRSTAVVFAKLEGLEPSRNGCVPAIGHVEAQDGGSVVRHAIAGDYNLAVGGVLGEGDGVLSAGAVDGKDGGAAVIQLALVIGNEKTGPLLKVALDSEKTAVGHGRRKGKIHIGGSAGSGDRTGLHQRPVL